MSTALEPAPVIETLADLLERLGHVPLERIRMHPPPGTATEADVLTSGTAEKGARPICELIDGVLVEKAVGYSESLLASLLIELLNAYVRPRNLGLVTGAEGTVRLFPGQVRVPDVAFTSWDRLPGRRRPDQPIPNLAPDLAIEVLSFSNTAAEMRRKRQDYFTAGVRLIWEVEPELRTVSVYTAPEAVTVLTRTDTLDGGTVLPGFTLPLTHLFAELDRHG
jgi:Uma2 family endonuclease